MATIKPRKKTFIIGKPTHLPADAVDVSFDALTTEIEQLADQFSELSEDGTASEAAAKVISRPSTSKGGLESLVVEMSDDVKQQLELRHGESIFVEEDAPLFPLIFDSENDIALQNFSPNVNTESLEVRVVVRGPNGESVQKARITLSGMLWVDHGLTDQDGRVTLSLLGETIDTISRIEVKPAHGYWSLTVDNPAMVEGQDNEVQLRAIGASVETDGDASQLHGWGQEAMGLTATDAPDAPVTVAVIDSGLFADHGDLSATLGFDFGDTTNASQSWAIDGSGHGTHVAGICAAQNNQIGILGFAPAARLVGLRVFPNASNAKLIAALDWCIDNEVDVINMSLGGKTSSPSVQQRLQACREHGILPVAAAGNNGGAVLFPAAFAETMAVAAIGQFGTFPSDSSHQKHLGDGAVSSGSFFAPKFTCRGPEINVCAPGVAIVSSVPENGYAAWDGTSMASPHVAGFATRVLQLDPAIRDMPRNSQRSQAMFEAVIARCVSLPGLPDTLQGSGMPTFTGVATSPETPTSGLAKVKQLLDQAIDIVEAETA